MLTIANIRDYIKTIGIGENFYAGKLDNKRDKSIGIYQRPDYSKANIAIGGLDTTRTQIKEISILVHWNENSNETEAAAQSIYDALLTATDVTINDQPVKYIALMMPEPVDVGTDDKGVYERVIWADFYYEED